MDWKYFWNGVNTALIFMLFAYVFITKDINTRAYEKAVEVEKRVDNQNKSIDVISTQKDTIVINMFNTNNYYKTHYAIK